MLLMQQQPHHSKLWRLLLTAILQYASGQAERDCYKVNEFESPPPLVFPGNQLLITFKISPAAP